MEIFLVVASIILLIFGLLFLFFPNLVKPITKITNRVLFDTEDKVYAWRRPIGIASLILAIYLWYVVSYLV